MGVTSPTLRGIKSQPEAVITVKPLISCIAPTPKEEEHSIPPATGARSVASACPLTLENLGILL